ncbi:small acid-soluble spore protein Tlp [Paenibacillus sp. CAA11]|uniref:small acid-soluble spore protein Tlp n=1 Tax=Paenibacillus sp. CAA11 TaxID=1532905 RepID=UPI000D349D0A|nr:small acid-soluble spore protein Tlp [Paenibacillus sp. CAA11]AWB45056.1 small acid-soluble spore protein Tlp [Paenibacillus sp. CAA11]
MTKPKPDNRADNVERLQESIQNTLQNLHEGEEYLDEHAAELSGEEQRQVAAKNERRRESIEGFREEVKDEARARRNK